MDRQFLEFLGHFYLNAARGQKQIEDMAKWMGGGFSGFDELTKMFREFYGISAMKLASAEYNKAWEKASENFKRSYQEWLKLMSVVPKSEFEALKKKNAALEEKIRSEQETIQYLRRLLNEEGIPHSEPVQSFMDMMEEQGRQFQTLMDSMGKAINND